MNAAPTAPTVVTTDEHHDESDFQPTFTEGYKPSEKKSIDAYRELDKEDESLARWKASLGIDPNAPAASSASGPKVSVLSLSLTSPTLPAGKTVSIELDEQGKAKGDLKKNPVVIKEGVEYSVGIKFRVNHDVISGLRYMQVVKRAGMKVDKLESMIGSYGPSTTPEPYTKTFVSEESPSGMLARSGTYNVRSRVIDDDGEVYADFEWTFKLGKDW